MLDSSFFFQRGSGNCHLCRKTPWSIFDFHQPLASHCKLRHFCFHVLFQDIFWLNFSRSELLFPFLFQMAKVNRKPGRQEVNTKSSFPLACPWMRWCTYMYNTPSIGNLHHNKELPTSWSGIIPCQWLHSESYSGGQGKLGDGGWIILQYGWYACETIYELYYT